jgi:hypothetical protein
MNLVTTISIIINIILSVCLFFKSALNDILKDVWQRRCKQKYDFRNYLIELRNRLLTLRDTWPHILVYQAGIMRDSNPEIKALQRSTRNMMIKQSGEAYGYIRDNECHYPQDIRPLFEPCHAKFSAFLGEIVKTDIYKERLLEMGNILEKDLDCLIAKTDEYLGGNRGQSPI